MKNKDKIFSLAITCILYFYISYKCRFYTTSKSKFVNNFEVLISEKNITELQNSMVSSKKI